MQRLNPPPNWPAPPAGWTPPSGWQPDPAWGPPPAGWDLWVSDDGGTRRDRQAAFGPVGIVAGALVVVLVLAQAALGIFSARAMGSAVGSALLPWLIVSLSVRYSRREWRWWAIVLVFFAVWVVLRLVSAAGQAAGGT
ncbi:hypothetical protein ACFO3K_13375 [Cellulomonas algicola]|uniref:Uncharacterized protein n=1 Tax=Cellulomonas algicola TaxID=2071633 RepID=A0A401UX33_9CELL|nr:hypothetical protein [Cellulomonas algicola]GCD19182.1 hypothetical protein CTKZ_07440 [Cellulomonas algicola]